MKKKLTKKENEKLYQSFYNRIEEIKKRNRKMIIETELVPIVIEQMVKNSKKPEPKKVKEKAIELFNMAVEKNMFDEFYHKKGN